MACRISLDQIRAMKEETLTAQTVGRVLGCSPQYIRILARESPDKLGFPVLVYRSRVKIPRRPFVLYMEGVKK